MASTASTASIVRNTLTGELPFFEFNGASWGPFTSEEKADARKGTEQDSRLKIMSQNVWFDSFQCRTRWKALAGQMREQDADIYCLQEITEQSLRVLLDDKWVRNNLLSSNDLSSFVAGQQSYDVCLFVAKRRGNDIVGGVSHRLPLTSTFRRGFLSLRLRLSDGEHTVGTVHLESTVGKVVEANRKKQWEEIYQYVARTGDTAFVAGDMNHCSTWPHEATVIDKSITEDAWTVLNGEDPSVPGFYTEDTSINQMLLDSKNGKKKQVRFDRILFVDHKKRFAWQPTSFHTLGATPVSDGIWISDHFGVSAEYAHRLDRSTED